MKIVRLGMTEGGLLILTFLLKYCKPNQQLKNMIRTKIMGLIQWLYTTSGYYDKSVKGRYFDFKYDAMNQNFSKFMQHLKQSVIGCEKAQFIFHYGLIMDTFLKHKQQFLNYYNITNFELLNETKIEDRMDDIFNHMKNKRVLIISCFGPLIKQQYDSGNMNKIYKNFPNIKDLTYVKFPYCFFNNGPHNNYFETLDSIFAQIKEKDFDIALLSCGSYGHMLCHKIHEELSKEAIYIGGPITNLFGILSSRERKHSKHIITNEYWITSIPDEYKPPNYKLIEDGCYW